MRPTGYDLSGDQCDRLKPWYIHEVKKIKFNNELIHVGDLVLNNLNKIIFQNISIGCVSKFHALG